MRFFQQIISLIKNVDIVRNKHTGTWHARLQNQ